MFHRIILLFLYKYKYSMPYYSTQCSCARIKALLKIVPALRRPQLREYYYIRSCRISSRCGVKGIRRRIVSTMEITLNVTIIMHYNSDMCRCIRIVRDILWIILSS